MIKCDKGKCQLIGTGDLLLAELAGIVSSIYQSIVNACEDDEATEAIVSAAFRAGLKVAKEGEIPND